MIALVDFSNVLHAAIYANPNLTTPSGRFTGGVFGLLNMTRAFMERNPQVNKVIFVEDAGVPEFRRKLAPEYKASRNKELTKAEREAKRAIFQEQAQLSRDILISLGCSFIKATDFEADDVIAGYVLYRNRKEQFVIVSRDTDLVQLIEPGRVHWQNGFNAATMLNRKRKGIRLERALTGDKSDNLCGVRGIGEAKAREIVQELVKAKKPLTPKSLVENYDGKHRKTLDKTPDLRDTLQAAFDVIDLRKTALDANQLMEFERSKFNPVEFKRLVKALRFKSIVRERKSWVRLFKRTTTYSPFH